MVSFKNNDKDYYTGSEEVKDDKKVGDACYLQKNRNHDCLFGLDIF